MSFDSHSEQLSICTVPSGKTSIETETTPAALLSIMKIEDQVKSLCSLQVSNRPTISANSNTLETSFDLPIDEECLPDFPLDSFEEFLKSNPDMTFKELSDTPMEQNDTFFDGIHTPPSCSLSNSVTHDETTNSSSEDLERDTINRRGLKKSGGPLRKLARFGNKQVIKYSDEYHDRRVKNNEAVKKSRFKAKEKQKETEVKMNELAEQNRTLNDRVDLLLKELQVLKSLYRELNQDLPVSAVRALERVNVR